MAGEVKYQTEHNDSSVLAGDNEYFDYADPRSERFSIEVLARSLGNTCRFGGHCNRFFSVAEHSVNVSHFVPPHLAVQGLLHDGGEAYVGDCPTPFKRRLPDFQRAESRIDRQLFRRWGLPETLAPEVKHADLVMLEVERRQLFDRHDDWGLTSGIDIPDLRLECWPPEVARLEFLIRAEELGLI